MSNYDRSVVVHELELALNGALYHDGQPTLRSRDFNGKQAQ